MCQDIVINALALLHVFIIQAHQSLQKYLIHYLWASVRPAFDYTL